jgi:hypothetical protein
VDDLDLRAMAQAVALGLVARLDDAWHGFVHAYYEAPRVRRPGSTGRIVGGYTFRPVFDAMAAIRDRAGLEPWPLDLVRLVPGGCEGCDR